MRMLWSFLIVAIAAPALLVLAQPNRIETFERSFRPHVSQGKIMSIQHRYQPQHRLFYINGVEYWTAIAGDALDASPDWTPSQPLPLGFARLEEIARQELKRLVADEPSWSVTSFQMQTVLGGQVPKWYYLVGMEPFWEPGPPGAERHPDAFWVFVDFSGKAGLIGRRQP